MKSCIILVYEVYAKVTLNKYEGKVHSLSWWSVCQSSSTILSRKKGIVLVGDMYINVAWIYFEGKGVFFLWWSVYKIW